MTNQLFLEIDKFDLWARSQFNIPQDDIGGEWECEYDHWNDIYTSFQAFVQTADPQTINNQQKDVRTFLNQNNTLCSRSEH